MANSSGIDGPGGGTIDSSGLADNNSTLNYDVTRAGYDVTKVQDSEVPKFYITPPEETELHHEPSVASTVASSDSGASSSGNSPRKAKLKAGGIHLDFNKLLMRDTVGGECKPAADIREMPGSASMVNMTSQFATSPNFHTSVDTSDIFTEDLQESDHHLNFSQLYNNSQPEIAIISNSSKSPQISDKFQPYAAQQYDDFDYQSHRQDHVHMATPMTTRISNNDFKTIQSANNFKMMHQQAYSSSFDENKEKKKRKKKKSRHEEKKKKDKSIVKRRRKQSLTGEVQSRTISIPEEDESEEINDNLISTDEKSETKSDIQVFLEEKTVTENEPLIMEELKMATFNVGECGDNEALIMQKSQTAEDSLNLEGEGVHEKKKKKHHKHHHEKKHHSRYKKHEDVFQRKMSGKLKKELEATSPGSPTDNDHFIDENELLDENYINEIKSHRYEDRVGIRNHLLHRPVRHKKKQRHIITKQIVDRNPHEMYVELDELRGEDGCWTEVARWIKFEEDVEENLVWGKPHAASLSFHSLHDLRKLLQNGSIILDMKADNLEEIARQVVDNLKLNKKIDGENEELIVYQMIMRKHKHIPGRTTLISKISQPLLRHKSSDDVTIREESHVHVVNVENLKLMRKIPEGCESAGVFVGVTNELSRQVSVLVRLREGRLIEDMVSLPIATRFVYLLLGPTQPDFDHHEIGRAMSTLLSDEEFRVQAYRAEHKQDMIHAVDEFLDDSVVLAPNVMQNTDMLKHLIDYQKNLVKRNKIKQHQNEPSEKEKLLDEDEKSALVTSQSDNGGDFPELRRTGKYFGGLVKDVKRRYKQYWSDIKDGLNVQCFAAIIFIYFAALSPAITFGGLLGEKTNNMIGASEMLLGCSIAGVLYGLFAGQPMLIIGSTGPLLVFEEAVYEFCTSNGWNFLAFRVWVGLWISVISVAMVMFEGSFIISYITKFTEEIFSTLISLIFIFETFSKLSKTYQEHPLKSDYSTPVTNISGDNMTSQSNMTSSDELGQPNTALLTTILMFGTFTIACFLRMFKESKFFSSSVRRMIGDFGVPIAIIIMVLMDYLIKDTYTQKLNVPDGLEPTDPTRSWLVNPLSGDFPVYMTFLAVVPALLVYILIFMESQITEMIISKKRLKKGTGFHLDTLIIGSLNFILPLLGLPLVCAATLRSITHSNSLTLMETRVAPGETPKVIGVREQRITTVVVNALLGVSILLQPILKEIPLAVLFGIFLYMGVMSLNGVELVERIHMLFMPAKNYPDFNFVNIVQPWRIHVYTFVQIICLIILWFVKSTFLKIAFPFFLVLTVPLRRKIISRFYTERELQALD